MTASELLHELGKLNVDLRVVDGNLAYRAPKGALDASLKRAIAESKPELLKVLLACVDTGSAERLARLERGRQKLAERVARMVEWLENNPDQPSFEQNVETWGTTVMRLDYAEKLVKALRARGYARIKTDALDGEVILLLRDENVHVPDKWKGLVSYTLEEIESMGRPNKEDLQFLHQVKKEFVGRIEPSVGDRGCVGHGPKDIRATGGRYAA